MARRFILKTHKGNEVAEFRCLDGGHLLLLLLQKRKSEQVGQRHRGIWG